MKVDLLILEFLNIYVILNSFFIFDTRSYDCKHENFILYCNFLYFDVCCKDCSEISGI